MYHGEPSHFTRFGQEDKSGHRQSISQPPSLPPVLQIQPYLDQPFAESLEDLPDVPRLLHRDDPEVIFFVDPDQEVLLVVVPDTTSIGPVTRHA